MYSNKQDETQPQRVQNNATSGCIDCVDSVNLSNQKSSPCSGVQKLLEHTQKKGALPKNNNAHKERTYVYSSISSKPLQVWERPRKAWQYYNTHPRTCATCDFYTECDLPAPEDVDNFGICTRFLAEDGAADAIVYAHFDEADTGCRGWSGDE